MIDGVWSYCFREKMERRAEKLVLFWIVRETNGFRESGESEEEYVMARERDAWEIMVEIVQRWG